MAASSNNGRVLENPVLRDRITFLKTTAETAGEYLRFEVSLAPGGGVLRHYHDLFTEQFEVLEGTLHIELDGQVRDLPPGQSALIPRGTTHRFSNPSAQTVRFITEVRPARQFEKNLRITYGLARNGRTNALGIPRNPLHLAVIFQYAETYLPGWPAALQRLPMIPLRIIARLLGIDRALTRYL